MYNIIFVHYIIIVINYPYPIGNCKVFKFQPLAFNASDNR